MSLTEKEITKIQSEFTKLHFASAIQTSPMKESVDTLCESSTSFSSMFDSSNTYETYYLTTQFVRKSMKKVCDDADSFTVYHVIVLTHILASNMKSRFPKLKVS